MTDTPAPHIVRAEDVYAPRRMNASTASLPLAGWAFAKYPPSFVGRDVPDLSARGNLDTSVTVKAEVNHGRWVARCPFCNSAQVASPADPRFLCAGKDGCANGPVRGAYVAVTFPDPDTSGQIETALMDRPDRANRNWKAPETVAALIEENEPHGLDNS